MSRRKRKSQANFLFSVVLAAGALLYFTYNYESPVENDSTSRDTAPAKLSTRSSEMAPPAGEHAASVAELPAPAGAPVIPGPQGLPPGMTPEMARSLTPPPPNLPQDLQAQMNAPPPELPEDLKRQLMNPPPELPPDLKAQLNAPPPELPEDIKKALKTPPRVVSIEEVNTPPDPGF